MSNDQKIMDKFVELSQEILFLKASNRALNSEIERCKEIAERDGADYSDVVRKLKIALQGLATAPDHVCSCCQDSHFSVLKHCLAVAKEIEGSIEKS